MLSWTWGCWAPVRLPAGNPIRCLSDWVIRSDLDPGSPPLVCRGLRRVAWALCPAAQCYWAMAAGTRAWSACRWDGWWGNVGSPLHKKKKIKIEWGVRRMCSLNILQNGRLTYHFMCFILEISAFKRLPEKRGRVSSGYMLASWMESWDRLTLYKGGRGPCVPYRMFPGFCSTIRLE